MQIEKNTAISGNPLANDKIGKLIIKFSIPCVLSLLVNALYNIVDQIFIGNSSVGYLGNTATTVVFPLTVFALAIGLMLGDGTAAYISICQGKNNTSHLHKAAGSSIFASFLISIIFVVLGIVFLKPLLMFFGGTKQSISLAMDYGFIIIIGFPFFMLSCTLNSIIRADGSPMYSMFAMIAGAVINVIFDPILIFSANMGIKGAAIATISGEIISFIMQAAYFFKSKTFKLKLNSFILDFVLLTKCAKMGISTLITQISIAIVTIVNNKMLVKYGLQSQYGADIPIAAVGVVMKVFTIVINIIVGIAIGGQPILGYNYGAKKYDRVRKTYSTILIVTTIVGLISTVMFEVFPQLIINVFGSQDEVYNKFARMTFRIFLMLIVFTCIIKISGIFFQSIGKPIIATSISLIRDVILLVPLTIILPIQFGINGVLYAAPVSDVIAMIITVIFVVHFFRNLDKNEFVEDAENETIDSYEIHESTPGYIITIAREHGSGGKQIGKLLADNLNIPFYDKELTALAAKKSGLDRRFIKQLNNKGSEPLHSLYMSTQIYEEAIEAQSEIIREIADKGACVIVGRAANYVLKEYKTIDIFIKANTEFKIKRLQQTYGDSRDAAKTSLEQSSKRRCVYYKNISGKNWYETNNYNICFDSSIGIEESASILTDYIKKYIFNK